MTPRRTGSEANRMTRSSTDSGPRSPAPGGVVRIRRALISVWDKSGVVDLAAALDQMGVGILSTGGTAQALREAEIPVTTVESVTGYPAILDGRVKTLHPAIFAAILGRDDAAHRTQLDEMGITPVDLVVVNLYPFESRALDTPLAEAVELIDIGGVALLRAAAKNWERVTVICHPSQYGPVVGEMREAGGVSEASRRALAAATFSRTAVYDAIIARVFAPPDQPFPERLTLSFQKIAGVRYGENPHQRAAFYRDPRAATGTVANATQLQGKELSFNNVVDLDAAWGLVWEFDRPAAAIIKHATPCGAAARPTAGEAYQDARACDPVSAFGGIVALNCEVDERTAGEIAEIFTEAVIAPGFTAGARALLARRPNVRILECAAPPSSESLRGPQARSNLTVMHEIRSVTGGLLVQERDTADLNESQLRVVTSRAPTAEEMADLRFAWKVCKWVKSNAIVLAQGGATVGIGSGQPNRVGAVEIAVKGAGDRARGAGLASDAFFPFRDGIAAPAHAALLPAMTAAPMHAPIVPSQVTPPDVPGGTSARVRSSLAVISRGGVLLSSPISVAQVSPVDAAIAPANAAGTHGAGQMAPQTESVAATAPLASTCKPVRPPGWSGLNFRAAFHRVSALLVTKNTTSSPACRHPPNPKTSVPTATAAIIPLRVRSRSACAMTATAILSTNPPASNVMSIRVHRFSGLTTPGPWAKVGSAIGGFASRPEP